MFAVDRNSSFNPTPAHHKRVPPLWQFAQEQECDWGKHVPKRRRTLDSISNTQINYSSVHLQPAACSNSNTGLFTLPPNWQNPTTSRLPPQPSGSVSVILNSLLSQGLISLSSGPSAVGVGVSQGIKSQNNQQVHGSAIGVEFGSTNLKLRRESVITALYSDLPRQCATCGVRFVSGEEHSKHMDWHVRKNRSSRNRKTKPSPMWFVTTDMWLRAAVAVGEAHRVPDCVHSVGAVKEVDLPADDDQPACALCRERFEDYYCHDRESWMYKGAVYVYAPDDGSTEGMDKSKLGPIVHAKCRSGRHRTRRSRNAS